LLAVLTKAGGKTCETANNFSELLSSSIPLGYKETIFKIKASQKQFKEITTNISKDTNQVSDRYKRLGHLDYMLFQ